MGRNDNRRSLKMRQRISHRKYKARQAARRDNFNGYLERLQAARKPFNPEFESTPMEEAVEETAQA